jgi:predicted nucleic acid-binding protein
VILDDHAARSEAKRLGLQVRGTLGILKKLMELEKYSIDLTNLYEKLLQMDFRVKESVFWHIFSFKQ